MANVTEHWIKASDGVDIYTRTWEPEDRIIATVVAVHGLGEHISRYNEMFTLFAKSGIKVHGFDQRGFGRTGRRSGILGHNDGLIRTLLDVKEAELRVRIGNVPHFIFGHSMGGGIVLKYATKFPENLTGVIASAPLVGVGKKAKVSIIEYYAVKGLSNILGTFAINNPVDPKYLALDPQVGAAYLADPNVHPYITFRTATDIVSNGEFLESKGVNQFLPRLALLVTHGSDDVLTCPIASKKFVDACPSKDKNHKLFQGGYHEMHNDRDRTIIYKLYIDWILERIPTK
ncbi:hypothetical protein HDU76_010516 [Blyttiomyces sp. JEL0837]|nr:hypothetical protein HDU76_010516 [Blyttiomyces sp. JEL0837]